ncbi:hypothetical protein T4B_1186 [Trichinella pseudospiralis]|uniref:Uncharacterized protein n=1 Tax=Trichinella pseudospiralis TaxID=6337 RepID=A0A0V1GKN6_TRIPS|nr:hypothetical protein T4A_4156 [Trichinella pseudospiralis]KRY98681.1 hypothetical protein T4B_1186 [Trichinella pseudospiralis]
MEKKERKCIKPPAQSGWIGWIESFVRQLHSLVKLRRNKRPILRYFLAMMIM